MGFELRSLLKRGSPLYFGNLKTMDSINGSLAQHVNFNPSNIANVKFSLRQNTFIIMTPDSRNNSKMHRNPRYGEF